MSSNKTSTFRGCIVTIQLYIGRRVDGDCLRFCPWSPSASTPGPRFSTTPRACSRVWRPTGGRTTTSGCSGHSMLAKHASEKGKGSMVWLVSTIFSMVLTGFPLVKRVSFMRYWYLTKTFFMTQLIQFFTANFVNFFLVQILRCQWHNSVYYDTAKLNMTPRKKTRFMSRSLVAYAGTFFCKGYKKSSS